MRLTGMHMKLLHFLRITIPLALIPRSRQPISADKERDGTLPPR